MSVVPPLDPVRSFGSGDGEPWARALAGTASVLTLLGGRSARRMEFDRWAAEPDDTDLALLEGLAGPVLDVGCGPGRMVRGALDAGLTALGIDVAPAAVLRCRADGLPVLHRSVFDRLPREGQWGAVLLLDGNVGIGGDAALLLARCRDLLASGGLLVVELHGDDEHDVAFLGRLVDESGRSSAAFPWAEVGETGLLRAAAGYALDASWCAGERRFLRLRRLP